MKSYIYAFFFIIFLVLTGCTQDIDQNNSGTGIVYDVSDLESQIIGKQDLSFEKNYEQNTSVENLRLLIDYLWSDFQYNKAANYFQELMKKTDDRERKKLLQIVMNDTHPNPGHYETLASFLDEYNKEGKLDTDDYIFYDFTIKLLNGVFNKSDINLLTGDYVEFKNNLWKQFDLFYSYKDAPDYYRTALFAIAYFKHGDLGVAKSLANKALESNPEYILPYQIKTYVGVLTRDFTGAKQNLDILLQLDSSSSERYQFLLGVSYFTDQQYTQSKNYLLQMKSPNLTRESLRYLIFIERTLKGKKDYSIIDEHDKLIVDYTERLFDMNDLKSIDFQTFFDWYFYDRMVVGTGGLSIVQELYRNYPNLLQTAIEKCGSSVKSEQYICAYGEGIFELLKGNHEASLKKLIPLVKKYPQRQLYYLIGLLYKEQGLLENAKVYFGRSLQYIDVGQRDKMSDIILELLNKSV